MARTIIPRDLGAAMTFRELYYACTKHLGDWGYSRETVHVYDRTYSQFLAYLKSVGAHDDIRAFNDRNTLGFAESLARRGIHPNTIIKALSALRTLAKYARQATGENLVPLMASDPTASFRWPQAQQHETRYLAPDDLKRLIHVEAPPYKALPRDLLIETGMRVGEACRLDVGDFRQEGRYYLALSVKGRGMQQRQRTREIPLSKPLGDALRDWLLARGAIDPRAPLLVNSEGERWKRAVLGNMIARLADAAGIERRVSPHKLRHTANVIARLAGIDAATRGRLLGHSSLRSLERYEHVQPHELHDARVESLAELQRYIGEPDRATPEEGAKDRNIDAGARDVNAKGDEDLRPS